MNTDTIPLILNYFARIEETASPCPSNTTCVSKSITINPTPLRNNSPADSICSGTLFQDTIKPSFSNGVTFAWSSSAPSTISGNTFQQESSNNIINDLLNNTSNLASFFVTYVDTLIYTGGGVKCKRFFNHSLKVNPAAPKPEFSDFTLDTNQVKVPDSIYCAGTLFNSFNVTSNTGANYLWSSNNPNVIIDNTTNLNTLVSFNGTPPYSAILTLTSFNTAQGNCPNTEVKNLSINVDGDADFDDEARFAFKKMGHELIYLDNSVDGYQWGFDVAATGQPFLAPGEIYQHYNLADTLMFDPDSIEQPDTVTCNFWVKIFKGDCQTKKYYNGIHGLRHPSEEIVSSDIVYTLMPNPSNGQFNLKLSGDIYGYINATIYNTLGQSVFKNTLLKKDSMEYYSFDVRKLPQGIYMLELMSNMDKRYVTKLRIY